MGSSHVGRCQGLYNRQLLEEKQKYGTKNVFSQIGTMLMLSVVNNFYHLCLQQFFLF